MKFKSLFFTAAISAAIVYGIMHSAKKLSLHYNKKTGRLFIDLAHRIKCCSSLIIEKMVISINGEVFKTIEYTDEEKPFDNVFSVDLPEADIGDLIEVRLKTRCSRSFSNRGRLEIE
jgi:hypothetical protein